jgi:hypothetical protein
MPLLQLEIFGNATNSRNLNIQVFLCYQPLLSSFLLALSTIACRAIA